MQLSAERLAENTVDQRPKRHGRGKRCHNQTKHNHKHRTIDELVRLLLVVLLRGHDTDHAFFAGILAFLDAVAHLGEHADAQHDADAVIDEKLLGEEALNALGAGCRGIAHCADDVGEDREIDQLEHDDQDPLEDLGCEKFLGAADFLWLCGRCLVF